ncbi:MAG: c-type cytochrome [Candidatus Bipolaricaulia bacterium]
MRTGKQYLVAGVSLVVAVLLVGCGRPASTPPPTPPVTTEAPEPEPEPEPPMLSPAEEGKALARRFGCISCHSADGSFSIGPTWQGLYGKEETLTDGRTVTVDDQFLLTKIIDPSAFTVLGFPEGLMASALVNPPTEEQAGAIITYIKTLQ